MAEQVQLRFIEQMPLDPQHGWQRDEMITAAEIKQRLSQHVEMIEDPEDALTRGSAPAELFRVVGSGYSVGIIAAVSKPFCGTCDRVRLTADGQIRNCLYAAAKRRKRRRARHSLGGSRTREAARPRDQRPELPATRPAHVGDRRLERHYAFEESAGGEELRQGVAMIIAGKPVLSAVCGMDRGVVPLQVIRRRLPAASSRAH
jgi:molybdenum cofactor biosynthesis enzyme MoaA